MFGVKKKVFTNSIVHFLYQFYHLLRFNVNRIERNYFTDHLEIIIHFGGITLEVQKSAREGITFRNIVFSFCI